MSAWAARRFWSEVHVRPEGEAFAILLDDRPVRTPYRSALLAPTAGLAEAVAAEWRAQSGAIDPESMPFTRALNSAIDKVAPDPGPVAAMLAGYGETDLLCYRATHPEDLVARQAEVWDPYLDWADEAFGARLATVSGVMPAEQDAAALAAIAAAVERHDEFALTALHEVTTLTGSVVLGLAAIHGRAGASEVWAAARLDELYQISQWGADTEAEAVAAARARAVEQALRFYALSRTGA